MQLFRLGVRIKTDMADAAFRQFGSDKTVCYAN